jgi:hypothetical protein
LLQTAHHKRMSKKYFVGWLWKKERKSFRNVGGDRKCSDGSCYFNVEWDLKYCVGKFAI